jgi:glycosyltransferase involved in cell wall biosynthesis
MAKKKILMLCDHPLSTSGVGTQARWLIQGLLETGKYSFRVFGGAVKHDDYRMVQVNPDFIIKPTQGFGTPDMLRQVLATEKPDCILLFTDPRFFIWVWEMEDEIHQVCPIAYNHLWDNPPWPEFNRVLYESTDLVNCINHPTYEMVHERFPDKTNYIPHAVPEECFVRLPDAKRSQLKQQLLGKERLDHFVALYVGRNARRKMPNDILLSWKMFLEDLEKKHGHRKATMLMHTDPKDPEGPNLITTLECLGITDHVVFSKDRVDFGGVNSIYNISDVLVNRSCNEGFGLPVLEAKLTELPVIVLKTGGLARQAEDHLTGFQYGVAMEPEVRALVGNQGVPFIFEDFVSHETVRDAFIKMYEMPEADRRVLGKKCREHALRDYNIKSMIESWDKSLTKLFDDWSPDKVQRWRHKEL